MQNRPFASGRKILAEIDETDVKQCKGPAEQVEPAFRQAEYLNGRPEALFWIEYATVEPSH